ncbi:organic cation transporter protein-like [Amphiura filiformis]|uniref:organic cation transporter protein-like n=1 Tax=Amphiura filiformis TaxID=82378 RepID=UPI003B2163E4
MKFDEILTHLGAFGPYQRRVYFLLCLISIPGAWHKLGQVFFAGNSNFWCANTVENGTVIHQNRSAPAQNDLASSIGTCMMMNNRTELNPSRSPNITNISEDDVVACDAGWEFDHSQYKSTIIEDYSLVCDRKGLSHVAQSVFFAGNLAGSVLFGSMADCIGRTRTMLVALIMWFGSAIGTIFARDVYTYMTLRFFVSCGAYGTFLPSYILGTEFVGPSMRNIAGIANEFAFATGIMTLAGIAYFIRDWRNLQIAITVPVVLFFLYIPFLAESARWLISRGKYDKAEKIIRRVAEVNKKQLPSELFTKDETDNTEQPANFLVLFKTPNMACKTMNVMWNWCVNSLVYYGIALNIPNLGSNDYLAFFFSGLVEFPAYFYTMWACQHFGGRKLNLAGTLILSGTTCVITSFLDPGLAVTCVAMLGKFSAAASFSIIYIFSAEIYPTPVRTAGTGLSSAASRVGGMVAPLIFLLEDTWKPLPFMIFGSCALLAGVLTLLLPETRNKNLPETLEEGEEFGKPNWMKHLCGSEQKEKIPQEPNLNISDYNGGPEYTALETEETV